MRRGRRAPAEQRELDVLEPVVELEGVEGQGRGLGCLARRRPEDLDLDRTPGRLTDPELELQVDCRGLGHGFPLGGTRVSYSLLGSLGEDRCMAQGSEHAPDVSRSGQRLDRRDRDQAVNGTRELPDRA